MEPRSACVVVLGAALLAGSVGTARAQDERDWSLELGVRGGYHSNYFFRGEGDAAPTSALVGVYSTGEKELRAGSSRYTLFYDANGVHARDVANGNTLGFLGGMEFRRGDNRITGSGFYNPNTVYDDEGDGVFFDGVGTEFDYRRDLASGTWVRGTYAVELARFDPAQLTRNSTTHEFEGTVRLPLGSRVGLRGAGLYSTRAAADPRHDFDSAGASAALEIQPGDSVSLFLRYRVRKRTYGSAPLGDSNFDRRDTIHDVVANVRWQVGSHWGVSLENYFRKGTSTRLSRIHSGNRMLAGVFVVF